MAGVRAVEESFNTSLKECVHEQQLAADKDLGRNGHRKKLAETKAIEFAKHARTVKVSNLDAEKDASTVYTYFERLVGGVVCVSLSTKYDEETKLWSPTGSATVVFKEHAQVEKLISFSRHQQGEAVFRQRSATDGFGLKMARPISRHDDGYIRFWLEDLKRQKSGAAKGKTEEGMVFDAERLQLGNQISDQVFSVWWEAKSDVVLEVSALERCMRIKCEHGGSRYSLTFKLKTLRGCARLFLDSEGPRREVKLIFTVRTPPFVYKAVSKKRLANPLMLHTWPRQFEHEEEWRRTTDFTAGNAIGTCRLYHLHLFDVKDGKDVMLKRLTTHLLELNMLDGASSRQKLVATKVSTNEAQASMLDSIVSHEVHWRVRCLMSKDLLHLENISEKLIDLLNKSQKHCVLQALDEMLMLGKPVYDPVNALNKSPIMQHQATLESIPPAYCAVVPRMMITPTRVVCHPPEQEMSNRVLREFPEHVDGFLRVVCADEDGGKMFLHPSQVGEEVKERIRKILAEGFALGGNHYRFLAFSSSQIRDNSCWMSLQRFNFGPENIRKFMGEFNHIRVPGKYAARMGQCFSSTIETVKTTVKDYEEIDDVTIVDRDGREHVFSDGVGRISFDIALEIAESIRGMGLSRDWDVPSAFQIRYKGCKGMLAWWPFLGKQRKVQVRPSMKKFESVHPYIEVLAWARFMPGYLNRQVILLLATLKIGDNTFLELQRLMVDRLNRMLEDAREAHVLVSQLGGMDEPVAVCIKSLLDHGLQPSEPFLRSCLMALRAWNLKELKARARIFVKDSCYLYGIMDEVGVLEYGQVYVCIQPSALAPATALRGRIMVTKNPCLHPGDIRVLEAVAPPELAHLKNVIVFPKKGIRPHPAECSGSDLDGDQYYVCWEPRLVPREHRQPYHYPPGTSTKLDRDVTITDIIDFFIRHMENDNLGTIANAHIAWASVGPQLANHENCLKLAELHHFAVDCNKTGMSVHMDENLRIKSHPHFQEKKDKRQYHCTTILGRLYDEVITVPEQPQALAASAAPVAPNPELVLDNFPEFKEYVQAALPMRYAFENDLMKIMHRYEVFDEGQVVTGCLLHSNKYQKRQRDYNVKIQVLHDVRSLWSQFLSRLEASVDPAWGAARRERHLVVSASAWYFATYDQRFNRQDIMPLCSFPWVAHIYLTRARHLKSQGPGPN